MIRPSLLIGTLVSLALLGSTGAPRSADAAGACTITGTLGPDHLVGTPLADVICGAGGADTIEGRGGNDRLLGGPGPDTLVGGPGRDLLVGGPGNDMLRGGPAADLLRGGAGVNRCDDRSVSAMSGCRKPGTPRQQPRRPSPTVPSLPPAPYFPPPSSPTREPETDTSAPSLQSLRVSTENVEIAAGDWWVRLTVSAWDESGVQSAVVEIEGPDGEPWRDIALGSGTAGLTTLSTIVEVPDTTPVGDYRVSAVTLVDDLGNRVNRAESWLREYGMDAQFEVYDGPDREAPNVVGISFRPGESIDTSQGPVTVEVPIEVTDSGTGVKSVGLGIVRPLSKGPWPRPYRAVATLTSGTERDGIWLAKFELPAGAAAGFYPVDELVVEDNAGHFRDLSASSLEEADLPDGFTQVGAADTTRPEITSFSVEPQVVHTAAGENEIDVEIGTRDTWSGVDGTFDDPISRVRFWLTPPDWPISWGMSGGIPELIAGTYQDGVWRMRNFLEEHAGFGTWRVRYIEVTDRAGNTTRIEDGPLEDFEAEGWDLDFENLP
ncbi:MAG TPA: calcium-binding protein [Solirubrobacterales bacterium]|nr:calcium-binding protein [Solirubrobacterales bacterium]